MLNIVDFEQNKYFDQSQFNHIQNHLQIMPKSLFYELKIMKIYNQVHTKSTENQPKCQSFSKLCKMEPERHARMPKGSPRVPKWRPRGPKSDPKVRQKVSWDHVLGVPGCSGGVLGTILGPRVRTVLGYQKARISPRIRDRMLDNLKVNITNQIDLCVCFFWDACAARACASKLSKNGALGKGDMCKILRFLYEICNYF